MAAVTIRLLDGADAGALLQLRREALLDSPLAFLASPEDDLASSVDAVRTMLAGGTSVFGAFDGELCGMLGLHRGRHLKGAHKVNLWGMFVRGPARGQGTGGRLLAAALAHARMLPGARAVHLSVSGSAPAARRLYERAGFRVWGTEPGAIEFAGQLFDEHHLVLPLTGGTPVGARPPGPR